MSLRARLNGGGTVRNGGGRGSGNGSPGGRGNNGGGGGGTLTSLLLHCDGGHLVTAFTDSSSFAHTVTNTDTAKIYQSNGALKFGVSSLYAAAAFNAGDYLSIADHSSLRFGSSDFCIELWMRWNSQWGGAYDPIFCAKGSASASAKEYRFSFDGGAANNLVFEYSTNGTSFTTLTTSTQQTWTNNTFYAIAVTRSGSELRFFVNGVQQGVTRTITGTIFGGAQPVSIIEDPSNGGATNLYMDEIRISKGTARYTADYTPATSAFTSD